jgi:hypothetical protein
MLNLSASESGLVLPEGQCVSELQLARSPLLMQLKEEFHKSCSLPLRLQDFRAWQASVDVAGQTSAEPLRHPAALVAGQAFSPGRLSHHTSNRHDLCKLRVVFEVR